MTISEQTIDELLELAHIRADQYEPARRYLAALLLPSPSGKSPARSTFDAGLLRGTAGAHNKKLKKVQVAAAKLQLALIALRDEQSAYAHADFWYSDAFGPVYLDELERPIVLATIEAIRRASIDARMHTTRPRKSEQYNLANMAVKFFKRFTAEKSNAMLPEFVQAFFEIVTGRVGSFENEELTRAVKAALRNRNETRQKVA